MPSRLPPETDVSRPRIRRPSPSQAPTIVRLPTESLLPVAWGRVAPASLCYAFNPSLAVRKGERLLAYRVVLPDLRRRIAVCRLDEEHRVLPGSAVPLSDLLVDGGDWHADPRLCLFGDRLFLHYNNGGRIQNDIFLVELDPATLQPMGPCRTLALDHPRAPVEKNWMFFAHEDALYAVYSIAPHRVHRVDIGRSRSGPVPCVSAHDTPWDSSALTERYGLPRGSTAPVRLGDRCYSFFHTRYQKPLARRVLGTLLHRQFLGAFTYGTGVYAFQADPPFAPASCSPELLFEPPLRPESSRPALSPWNDSVIYASGAILDGDDWVVSVGIHDDGCGLMRIPHTDVLRSMRPVSPQGSRDSRKSA